MEIASHKKFLDYDKKKGILYNNLYLNSHKIVVKIPISARKDTNEDMILERFNLTKYVYLVGY
ncbi:MAG: hypothetical protein ACOC44_15160 [Promethearchaeia archaeon]